MRLFLFIFSITIFNVAVLSQGLPDSTAIVYGWKLDDYTTPKKSPIDTLLLKLHNHNPIYKYSFGNAYLGNLGSPVYQIIFFDRYQDETFHQLSAFRPYLTTYDDITFVNTKKPFSHLFYTNVGSDRDKEETVDVFHSQNVNQHLNFGLRYNLYATKGQYLYQAIKKNTFSLFGSFTNDRYQSHATFNVNQYRTGESGGVQDSIYRFGDFRFNKEIPTLFSGTGEPKYESNVNNKIRYMDYFFGNRFYLTGKKTADTTITDTRTKSVIGEPILSYTFRGRRASKIYTDIDPLTNEYYDTLYSDRSQTYDSLGCFEIINSLKLEFKTTIKNKVSIGLYAGLNHEFGNYSFYSDSNATSFYLTPTDSLPLVGADSLPVFNDFIFQNSYYVSAGLYGNLFGKFTSDFRAKYYISGDKVGQASLRADLTNDLKIANYPLSVNITGKFDNIIPSFHTYNFYSNQFYWDEDFDHIQKLHLSGSIAAPSNKFRLFTDYGYFSNLIYYSEDILPQQHNEAVNIISGGVEKEFVLGIFHSENKVVGHLVSDEKVISVPKLVFHNSTYIDYLWKFEITKGELRTMLGFDIYYSTEYNGYGYDPVTSTFYQQDKIKVGNYPFIDVFLNVKLKQARGFLVAERLNSELFEDDYYTAIYYPQNTMAIKFGVAWTFYN